LRRSVCTRCDDGFRHRHRWVWLALQRPRLDLTTIAVVTALLAVLVFLTYLPVVLVSGPEALLSNRFVVPLDAATLARELPISLAHTWGLWNRDVAWPLAVVLLAGFGVSVARDWHGGGCRSAARPGRVRALVCCSAWRRSSGCGCSCCRCI